MFQTWNKNVLEYDKPFWHCQSKNFLSPDDAKKLSSAIDELEFYEEDHDLYKFYRTEDLSDSNHKIIQEFRKTLLSDEFISWMENTTGQELNRNIVELHCLKLTSTNYLLPHDDQVQGRKVAFILNFTEGFNQEDGGSLQLFETDEKNRPTKVLKSLQPEFNIFSCFVVSDKSYHQIDEVTTDSIRKSISGWYYER